MRLSQCVSMTNGNSVHSSTRARMWFLTLNNYTEDDLSQMSHKFSDCLDYVYQCEKGESGTPHIQGCFRWKNQQRASALRKRLPRGWWRPTRNWDASVVYCTKEETRTMGPWRKGEIRRGNLLGKLYLWQAILQKSLSLKPNDRSIVWITDREGNTGKTSFCKHIVLNNDAALYLSGSAKYMKYAIMKSIDDRGVVPKILLLDIPRSLEEYVSYQGIEEIKNGMFFNTHYEAKMVCYDSPHVVVFANFEPDTSKLSSDRWVLMGPELTSPAVRGGARVGSPPAIGPLKLCGKKEW